MSTPLEIKTGYDSIELLDLLIESSLNYDIPWFCHQLHLDDANQSYIHVTPVGCVRHRHCSTRQVILCNNPPAMQYAYHQHPHEQTIEIGAGRFSPDTTNGRDCNEHCIKRRYKALQRSLRDRSCQKPQERGYPVIPK